MLRRDTHQQHEKVLYRLAPHLITDETCMHGRCLKQVVGFSYTSQKGCDDEDGYYFCEVHGLEHMAVMNYKIRLLERCED